MRTGRAESHVYCLAAAWEEEYKYYPSMDKVNGVTAMNRAERGDFLG